METVPYEQILEKCGAEAFAAAIVVCLISALIKNKFKLSRRIQTAIELVLSFAITAIIAFITKNGDLSGVVVDGLSTAGVSLAVCGFICGDAQRPNIGALTAVSDDEKSDGEKLKALILSIPDIDITESEADLIAKMFEKLKNNSDK